VSVRSRLAAPPAPVNKGYGTGVPAAIVAAEAQAGMTPATAFSPGQPIGPYDGFSRQPRAQDFVTGYNIATRPRTHERVSFETLKGLLGAYDVADLCIWHRIDSVRSLDWQLIPADGVQGDVQDAITAGLKALEKPDRIHYFETWLGKWLYDVLAYDAAALYRLRNRAGRCIGLLPADGTTFAPLLDDWGNPPGAMEPPGAVLPPSHVQYVQGLPWNWLTRNDLIYEPYRMHNDSPYGRAPIESILLNANTDIRFQLFFLQTFTEGNLPAAFASAPDSWSPEQIEQFQELWDSFMTGDQSRKHQIRWLPPGSKFTWSNEKEFSDQFSLFLMRKTAAAYHVVPADLGFTENVNKSSGESQADVQHRVGDLPFIRYIQRIITSFLRDDLGLPVKFSFDLGEEQADRADQAAADKVYVDMGAVSASFIGEMRYGTADPVTIPRYIMTSRGGPVPVSSLMAVAGEIDQETGLPLKGAPLPKDVFGGAEGVLAEPPIKVTPLAERLYGPQAMPPAPPPQPQLTDSGSVAKEGEGSGPCAHANAEPVDLITGERVAWVCPECDTGLPADWQLPAGVPVAKEGEGSGLSGNVTAGITAETGIYGNPLIRGDDDEDGPDNQAVAKAAAAEMAAFRRFAKARRREGEWRDFEFRAVPAVRGHNLNDDGRLAVRKAAGEVAVAGLAVLAQDTGRVLMIQRALDPDDPAGGKVEFPGGHLDGQESPLQGAWREFCEEVGSPVPWGVQGGTWTSADGIYQGTVWTTESEASVPVRGGVVIPNPDDPDGDQCEAIFWIDPADLAGNPMLRPELAASLGDVLPLLGCEPEEVAAVKAAKAVPKGRGPDGLSI
jgi:8-oxo-dGTP pyrophosphatase MutT (NUDIX family)